METPSTGRDAAGLNAKGNRRGMTKEAQDALKRGRKTAAKNQGKGRRGHAGPGGRIVGLRGRAAELVEQRIKNFIEAYDEDPQFLTASVVGTMLADIADANQFLRKAWAYVHGQMEDGKDPSALLSLVEELRRWSKLTQETALRVAEISRRGAGGTPDDYLRGRYGLRAPDKDAELADDDGLPEVPVTVVAGTGPRAGGNGSPFDAVEPVPEPRPGAGDEGDTDDEPVTRDDEQEDEPEPA